MRAAGMPRRRREPAVPLSTVQRAIWRAALLVGLIVATTIGHAPVAETPPQLVGIVWEQSAEPGPAGGTVTDGHQECPTVSPLPGDNHRCGCGHHSVVRLMRGNTLTDQADTATPDSGTTPV